jgi:hypothetical protein
MTKSVENRAAAVFDSPLHLWIEIWQRQLVYARP